jgi:hypothetical protein
MASIDSFLGVRQREVDVRFAIGYDPAAAKRLSQNK